MESRLLSPFFRTPRFSARMIVSLKGMEFTSEEVLNFKFVLYRTTIVDRCGVSIVCFKYEQSINFVFPRKRDAFRVKTGERYWTRPNQFPNASLVHWF
jgi:hypothetical protein